MAMVRNYHEPEKEICAVPRITEEALPERFADLIMSAKRGPRCLHCGQRRVQHLWDAKCWHYVNGSNGYPCRGGHTFDPEPAEGVSSR